MTGNSIAATEKGTRQAAVTIRSDRCPARDACPGTNCQVKASRLLVVPGRHSTQPSWTIHSTQGNYAEY